MDELLHDFLAESAERVDAAARDLVRLEEEPRDEALIASLFRHVHTIKGASGFLDLPRVERLAHGAECLIGRLRDGAPALSSHVTLVLAAIDRLAALLVEIGQLGAEPSGDDTDLVTALEAETAALRGPCDNSPAPPPVLSLAPAPEVEAPAPTPLRQVSEKSTEPAQAVARERDSVRVSVEALDRLMGVVSELVLSRNQLLELSGALGDERVRSCVQNLSSVTTNLQDAVMRARMQPMGRLFATLPRLARDLSIELGKKIRIETFGAETELDRHVIEIIRAPLTHLIRNAADHGLEQPAQRRAAGKSETGVIRVSAAYDMGQITLEIADDGRGLDAGRIRDVAKARKLVEERALERMSEAELYSLTMLPGFSTAREVSKVSGRGVGLDVVRENIHAIGGSVEIASRPGVGATVALRIPLTLAIAPALVLGCGSARFAILQKAVTEVVGLGDGFQNEIQYVHEAPLLRLRGETLPLIDLRRALELPEDDAPPSQSHAVLLSVDGLRCGLIVDAICDALEIVLEPLPTVLARIGVWAGQTLLGDGSPALILNPASIAVRAGLTRVKEEAPALEPFAPQKELTRLLLMRAGAGALKALPLSLVMRIEEVEAVKLRRCGSVLALAQENFLLPVLTVADDFVLEARSYPMLVLAGAGLALGLLVEEVVDVIEESLDLRMSRADERLVGVANLRGEVVELLDITYYFNRADPAALTRGTNHRPRVLLVDDKQFFREMLGPIVVAAGYEVTTCASGAEALSLIDRGLKVDLLVTDIDMPEMDGYRLTREFFRCAGCAQTSVVALAPQADARIVEAARACGVSAVVGKFDRRALVETIDSLVGAAPGLRGGVELRAMTEAAA